MGGPPIHQTLTKGLRAVLTGPFRMVREEAYLQQISFLHQNLG